MPETQGHPQSSHGQFVPCRQGEDEMVSYPHWSYDGWFKTSGLSTQRKPPYCLPAFLVIQLHSLLHFILYIYACLFVFKVQERPAIGGKKDTPHCEVALLSDCAGDSQFGNITMSFNTDSKIICKYFFTRKSIISAQWKLYCGHNFRNENRTYILKHCQGTQSIAISFM